MTTEQVDRLRAMTDESSETSTFSPVDLQTYIDEASGDLNAAAGTVWFMKAAKFASLVNTSESGSSRALGDLYKNAMAMAAAYGKSVGGPAVGPGSGVLAPRTRAIQRA